MLKLMEFFKFSNLVGKGGSEVMEWYIRALKKYAVFDGRASRKEFWMFYLFNFFFALTALIIDGLLGTGIAIYNLYTVALIIPTLAISVRRLHDIDKSGFYLLLILIPIIGTICLLLLFCIDGTPGDNRYGPNPKEIIAMNRESTNQLV